jgi:tetratricopeptide (TPR) repeat protein
MNKRTRHVLISVSFTGGVLLNGCFGGTTAVVKSENQQRATIALTRGVRAEQKGNYLEAYNFLNEALTIGTSIEDNSVRITSLINLARLYRLQHNLPQAEQYMNQALAVMNGDSTLFAEAAHEKSLLELSLGNPSTALTWAQRSMERENGNLLGTRQNLASRVNLVLGNGNAAQSLAHKALENNRSSGQAEEEANSLRILGIIARNDGKNGESQRVLLDALAIDKRIGRSGKIAVDLEELATTSQTIGDLKQAALYLGRACDIHEAAGRLEPAMKNQLSLAGIYDALGDTINAGTSRDLAWKLSKQIETLKSQNSSVTMSPSNKP